MSGDMYFFISYRLGPRFESSFRIMFTFLNPVAVALHLAGFMDTLLDLLWVLPILSLAAFFLRSTDHQPAFFVTPAWMIHFKNQMEASNWSVKSPWPLPLCSRLLEAWGATAKHGSRKWVVGSGHGDCDHLLEHGSLRQVLELKSGMGEKAEGIAVRSGQIWEGPIVGRCMFVCMCVCSWQSRFPGTQIWN